MEWIFRYLALVFHIKLLELFRKFGGPPGCGKTTLLKALSGNLDKNLKRSGEISYNGHGLDEFVPQKSSAYISQYDLHIAENVLKAQILAFRRLKKGEGSLPPELLQAIAPPLLELHRQISPVRGQVLDRSLVKTGPD